MGSHQVRIHTANQGGEVVFASETEGSVVAFIRFMYRKQIVCTLRDQYVDVDDVDQFLEINNKYRQEFESVATSGV